MDLQTFYSHARTWRDQKEEAQRLAAEENEAAMRAEWNTLFLLARDIFPIAGSSVFETISGQTNEPLKRNQIICLDVVIDPAMKKQVEHGDGKLLDGVVRAIFFYNTDIEKWEPLKFRVHTKESEREFENQYEAFLTAFKPL